MSHALAITAWVVFALIVLMIVGAFVIPHLVLELMAITINVVTG